MDVVCHLAAIANPEEYTSFPRKVMDVTLCAGLDIVKLCRLSDKLLFFTSTSEIYGKNPNIPFSEDDDRVLGSTKINRWCYSSSKSAVEHYIYATAQEGHLRYVVTRLFNVYGPRLRGRVVSKFIEKAIQGKDLQVHGDGRQTRCFTYIDDAVDAFVGLILDEKAHNNCYNVGTQVEHTVDDLAEAIQKVSIDKIDIQKVDHASLYGKSYEDIPRRVPNVDRIKEAIGWEATTSLEEGVAKTYEYHKERGF